MNLDGTDSISNTELADGIAQLADRWNGANSDELFVRIVKLFHRYERPGDLDPTQFQTRATVKDVRDDADAMFRAALHLANEHGVESEEGGRQAGFALSTCAVLTGLNALMARSPAAILNDAIETCRGRMVPADLRRLLSDALHAELGREAESLPRNP